jgi:hypothetical protein
MTGAQTPAERLTLSRERLRRALTGAAQTSGEDGAGRRTSSHWWDELRALPGAGIVIEAVQHWWAKHPLRVPTLVAFNAAQTLIQPLAQRHPLGLMLGSLVVGGLLAWQRPWRWALIPALWAGLLPQLLLTSLAAQASRKPTPRAKP